MSSLDEIRRRMEEKRTKLVSGGGGVSSLSSSGVTTTTTTTATAEPCTVAAPSVSHNNNENGTAMEPKLSQHHQQSSAVTISAAALPSQEVEECTVVNEELCRLAAEVFQSPPSSRPSYHSALTTSAATTSRVVATTFLRENISGMHKAFVARHEARAAANDISVSRKRSRKESGGGERETLEEQQQGVAGDSTVVVVDRAYRAACDAAYVDSIGRPQPPCRSVDAFKPEGRISQGVYGVVFRGRCKQTKTLFALKQLKGEWLSDSQVGFPPFLLRELELTLRMRHPNVIRTTEVVFQREDEEVVAAAAAAAPHASKEEECEGNINLVLKQNDNSNSNGDATQQQTDLNPTALVAAINASVNGGVGGVKATAAANDVTNVKPSSYGACFYAVMEHAWRDLKGYLYERKTPFLHLSKRNVHPEASSVYIAKVKCIAKQLFEGLAFLHARYILHRDLKTSNVLLFSNGTASICDLGLGKFVRRFDVLTPTVVTLMYRAPELHLGISDYDAALDVWSIGCIIAELFLKAPLFRGEDELEHCSRICDILGYPSNESFEGIFLSKTAVELMTKILCKPSTLHQAESTYRTTSNLRAVFLDSDYSGAKVIPPECLNLLESIFQWNPRLRPTAAEALRHPFFTSEAPAACPHHELVQPMPFIAAHQQATGRDRSSGSVAAAASDSDVCARSASVDGGTLVSAAVEEDIVSLAQQELEEEQREQEAQAQGVCNTSPEAAARKRMLGVHDDDGSCLPTPLALSAGDE